MPIIERKFGMTFEEVRAARERWRRISNDCDWKAFDDYLQWMVDSGWSKGKHLGKRNSSLPHGPDNSIWLTPDREHMAEVACTIPNVEIHTAMLVRRTGLIHATATDAPNGGGISRKTGTAAFTSRCRNSLERAGSSSDMSIRIW
jgi:hypothetical protein